MSRANIITILVLPLLAAFACTSHKEEKSVTEKIQTLVQEHVFTDDRPFAQCHASTLVRTADNQFLVAWFGGTHEKHDDVGIWLSKGKPGHWSAPVQVAKIRFEPHWNPVLHRTDNNDIILFFKVGKSIDAWETWFMLSHDNGTTWSQPQELVPGDHGGRGPVRNKIITLKDGTWLAPASNELKGNWNAFVDRSTDQGKTWTATSFLTYSKDSIPAEGIIQPTLWQSANGSVHMLLRSSAGVICRSDSKDNGLTWSPVYKTKLPNPNSGIDLSQLSDGSLALLYNRSGKNWGPRWPLAVAVSHDDGQSWPLTTDIEPGKEGDEFSYPAIVQYGDTLFATYTWKRQRIAFWSGILTQSREQP
jgi:predicted neuraminidase